MLEQAPNIWRIKFGIIALPALLQVLLVAVLSMFRKVSKPSEEVSYPNCVSSLFFDSNLKHTLAAAIFVQACTDLTGIKYVTHLASDLELSFLPFLIISGSVIGMVLVHLFCRKTMLGLSIPFLALILLFLGLSSSGKQLLISLFIFIHTSCVASISTVFTVEILPPPFKGFGGGITTFFQYLLGFGVTFFIQNTTNLLGNSTVAIVFASLSTFTSLITIFFIPESKYVSNTLPPPSPSNELNSINESLHINIYCPSDLQQALGERISPVNRMDQCFLQLQVDVEEVFHTFRRVMRAYEVDEANMMELLWVWGEDLMGQTFMKNWLPASSALVEVMIFLPPSRAANSIAEVPFMHYGNQVLMVAVSGKGWSLYVKILQRNKVWMGKRQETIEDFSFGNTVAMVGLDRCLKNSSTLTDEKEVVAHPIRAMKLSVSPVMFVAVQCKVASDLPKIVEGLNRLAKAYPLVVCSIEESGEHIIAGAGEVHIEICLKDFLDDFVFRAEITQSDPVVSFRETVLEKSCRVVMSESPNKHHRLYMGGCPMEDVLAEAIDEGPVGPGDDPRGSKILSEEFGWEKYLAKKIWCFGPHATGPNMLVDMCKGVQYLNEMKDSVAARKVHWLKKT